MSGMRESLVRMANQIARNFAVKGEDAAVAATADHIRKFWDPRMKAQGIALLADDSCGLSQPARRALAALATDMTGSRG